MDAPRSPNPTQTNDRHGRSVALHLLLIAFAVLVVFRGTLTHEVIWDGEQFVNVEGRLSDALRPSFWAHKHHEIEGTPFFRPFTTVTYLLDKRIWGSEPFGYHLTTVLLHLAVCLLLYTVLAALTGDRLAALLGALFYGIHPLRIEPVALISGRTDLLCGLFLLAAMGFLIRLQRKGSSLAKNLPAWIGLFACFLLSLFSKETSAPFVIFAPILVYAQNRREGRPLGWSWLAFAAVPTAALGLFFHLRAQALAGMVPTQSLAERLDFMLRTFPATLGRYAGQQVLFTKLTRYYQLWDRGSWGALEVFVLGSWIVLCAVFFALAQKGRPWPLISLCLFTLFCLPASGIFALQVPMSDRYQYIPDFGFALAFGLACSFFVRKSPRGAWRTVAGGAVVLCLAVTALTAMRDAGHWKNAETLWYADTQKNDTGPLSFANLGNEYRSSGRTQLAFEAYRRAAKLSGGTNPKILLNLGSCALSLGRLDEAESAFSRARQSGFDPSLATYQLARAKALKGDLVGARNLLEQAEKAGHCHEKCRTLLSGLRQASDREKP